MNDAKDFEEISVSLHSETVPVIRRMVNGRLFCIAAVNGRTRVWAERFHEIEPEFLDWCDQLRTSDVVWDIGAPIGHFPAFAALKSGAKVYAFEPEALNYGQCALNHYLNFEQLKDRMVPLGFCIANRSGLHDMVIQLYGAGEHTKCIRPDADTYKVPVLFLGLHEILAMGVDPPSAIKIDVDGSESEVISALAPIWPEVSSAFIELPLHLIDEVVETLSQFGLRLKSQHKVVRLSGGYYDDIANIVFARPAY